MFFGLYNICIYISCIVMSKPYYQTIHQIITMGHWITDQVSQELKEFDITEPQYNVLRILAGAQGEPKTVQDILEGMVQRNSNVTRIVDKLLLKGLVERKECLSNRRKMDITITQSGVLFLKKLDRKVYAFHRPMIKNLDIENLELLKGLLLKLRFGST